MGAIVAVLPADPAGVSVENGDSSDALHVTLCWLGDDVLDEATVARAQGALAPLRLRDPFTANVSGAGILGPDAAVVKHLDGAEFVELKDAVAHALGHAGVDVPPDSYPSFVPHLTVGYPESVEHGNELLSQVLPDVGHPIDFDRLAIMNGDDVHTLNFEGGGGLDAVTADHSHVYVNPSTAFKLTEFANPWHDEIGRFAPKGTGSRSRGVELPIVGNVDDYLAANPQMDDEPIFVYHGRLVDGLPPDVKHALLFEVRETYEPVQYLAEGMTRWREMHNLPEPQVTINQVPAPLKKGDVVAEAFEQAPEMGDQPRVQAAFDEFKRQSEDMWDFMTAPESEGGLGVEVEFWTDPNPENFGNGPYPNATAQADDLRYNRRIKLESGLGGAHEATMTRDEYDRFRAVHDVFGHAGVGTGFDRHGEYQAYLAHASMYTGDGHRAMASEYHGVNTSVWAGDPGSPGTGKSVILAEPLISNPWNPDGSLAPVPEASDLEQYLRERGLVASGASDTMEAIRYLIDKTGMKPPLAQRYDDLPWHTVAPLEATPPADDPSDETIVPLPGLKRTFAVEGQTHAGLIIKAADSGRVLMTQRTPYHGDDHETYGAWEFPGGNLDPGEDAIRGAVREFQEETGLALPEGYEIVDEHVNGSYSGFIVVVPNEAWTTDAELLTLETMGIGWFDLDQAVNLGRPEIAALDHEQVMEAAGLPRMTFAAAAPAEPTPPILVGMKLRNADTVPHEGAGLPYLTDHPYVALVEVEIEPHEVPAQLAQVLEQIDVESATSTGVSSLTASNPLRRGLLMDPEPLVGAYDSIRAALEPYGTTVEDYPFAVQLGGDTLSVGEVKGLKGNELEFDGLVAVLPDGTVVHDGSSSSAEPPPSDAPQEEAMNNPTDTDETTEMSAAARFRAAASAKRQNFAEDVALVDETNTVPDDTGDEVSVDNGDSSSTARIELLVEGSEGSGVVAEFNYTGDVDALRESLAGMTLMFTGPDTVDLSALEATLVEHGAEEIALHDDLSTAGVSSGSYELEVRVASDEEAEPADDAMTPAPEFAMKTDDDKDADDSEGETDDDDEDERFQFTATEAKEETTMSNDGLAQWEGLLVVEGIKSGDGRQIESDALTWRNLPLPLMMMTSNPVGGDGHDGAELAGRIDWIERRDDGEVWGGGLIDTGSSAGQEAYRLLTPDKAGLTMLRGVSVDLDDVEMSFDGADVFDLESGSLKTPPMKVAKGRVMGATLTPFPAFQEAQVTLVSDALTAALSGEGCDCEHEEAMVASAGVPLSGAQVRVYLPHPFNRSNESLVASAGTSQIPVSPPTAWFDCPPVAELEDAPIRITAAGQVFGFAADDKACHIGFADRCVQVPKSNASYRYFMNKQTETADGILISTGPVMMDTVHPSLKLKASDAQAFYAHTGCAVADVSIFDTPKGMYIAGALRPTISPEQLRALRGSDISPDWRNIRGNLECVALLAVNTSGFITPALVASGVEDTAAMADAVKPGTVSAHVSLGSGEVLALVAAGMRTHAAPDVESATVASLKAELSDLKAAVEPLIAENLAARRQAATARLRARHLEALGVRHAEASQRFRQPVG